MENVSAINVPVQLNVPALMTAIGRFDTDAIDVDEWQETYEKAVRWSLRANQGIHEPLRSFASTRFEVAFVP